jgi:signal transduction histidine kinase/ActR/RegA family two-component response regulator
VASSLPIDFGLSIADREYFQEILSGREWAVGDLTIAKTEHLPLVAVCRAIRDEKGTLLGIVLATIDPERLDDVLAVDRSKKGSISLIDRKGMMVYRYPHIAQTWDQRKWVEGLPILKRSLEGEELAFIGIPHYEKDRQIIASVPIRSIGWLAGAGRGEEEATKPIISHILHQGIAFSFVCLLASLVALGIARTISSPVKRLRSHARVLRDGDLGARIAEDGPSDLKELSQTLNDMAERLQTDTAERKRAEDALKKSLQRLDLLSNTASQLLISHTPQQVVEVLCRRVMEHLGCHAFFNYLIDDARNCLRLNAYAGIPDETAKEIHFLDYGAAVCDCAARDGCRIVAENIPTTPDPRTDLVRSFGIKAYACHSLLAQGRVIGTLSFGTKSRLTFTEDELSLMKTVADQVATAMERIQLLQRAEERADELESRVQQRTKELQQAYDQLKKETREREQIEAQLHQSQKMEAIGTLAGGIAHDFNNILAAMLGFSELAVDDIPADSKAQRHLEKVLKAGLRARELVKQILAFSRKSEGERKQIKLTPLVHETHALLRSSVPTTIQMSLAITTRDDYVLADPTQLQQVLMNLATNAAHAMQDDGGQLTIGVSSVTFPRGSLLPDPDMEPGAYVKLTVKDTGTGMTEEVRQRIFEPFFTTKAPGKGTGMGLAVVYGIVKSHGGAVTVQSELGQGSIFDVFLPRAEKPEVNEEEETTSTLPTGTERILFVDDEEMLVDIARDMLESLGYHVTVTKHPTDAWRFFLADPSRFDLVITDQTMPDITGVALAKKILAIRPGMPIILCTGFSYLVNEESARAAGIIKAFLMKPLTKREIAQMVRRVLDG